MHLPCRYRLPLSTIARAVLCGGLAIAITTHVPSVKAQWVVTDPALFQNSVVHHAQTVAQWGETATRWVETAKHYVEIVNFWQEQLVKIKSLQFSLFKMKQSFPKISEDFGVEQACPGKSGSSTSITKALTDLAGSLTGGSVTTRQHEVCVMIQKTLNRKYEATRLYLEQIEVQASALEQLARLRLTKVGASPGKLASYGADTSKYAADMAQARDTWMTHVEQLDAQLDMLRRRQGVLSREAIDGPPKTLLGTLVEMGALKAALSH